MGMERMQMKQVNSDNLFFVNSYVSLNFESILCPLIVHSMILIIYESHKAKMG